MAEQFRFELVTPERLLIDKPAAHVVVPGEEGDFGVLPEHAPVISTLRPGCVEVYQNAGAGPSERWFVKRGFVDAGPDRLVILAEDCIDPGEVDLDELDRRIRDTEEDLADAGEDELARRTAETELAWMRPLRELVGG